MLRFCKEEKIKGKLSFHEIITNGKKIKIFPFLFYFTLEKEALQYPIKVGINVPKKLFRKAVQRNLLKRRIREAYRLNKFLFYNNFFKDNSNIHMDLVIIFIGKKIISFKEISVLLCKAINKLIYQIREENIN